MEALSVAVRRGRVVESRHLVHAVAARGGAVVATAGDAGRVSFWRSSAKPFQALPLARARPDLGEAELAIACASHKARKAQLAAVRSLLAEAGATEDDLECGFDEGRRPGRIYHNCSGKHAGMLLLCRERGWPTAGYRLPEHPLQQELLAEVAAAAEVPAGSIPTVADGCGVVTFALPHERMAHAFSRLAELPGAERVLGAMRARPDLIGGRGASDTALMSALPGWVAKRGAEGHLCAAAPDGLGVALKVEDGNPRALLPAAAAFLDALGIQVGDELARAPVLNSRRERVGEVVAE